jgi:uncharacterized iron-regulated membrane protein
VITGIVLWWPKNKQVKATFTIKWNAKWRRKNYDLIIVMGFYATRSRSILALTGLVWGFEWFSTFVYRAVGGDKKIIYEEPLSSKAGENADRRSADKLWKKLKAENPNVDILEVHLPTSDATSLAVTSIQIEKHTGNRITVSLISTHDKSCPPTRYMGKLSEASGPDKLLRMNYDIHTGCDPWFCRQSPRNSLQV